MRSEEWRPAAAALEPSSREVGKADCRALRPGREELAVTDPAQMPVTEARHPEPKIATVRAPRGGRGRKAPRTRLACAPMRTPHGCLASTRTSLGAPPPLKFGGSEAKKQTPGAKNAPRERRSVVRCQLFQFVIPAEPR